MTLNFLRHTLEIVWRPKDDGLPKLYIDWYSYKPRVKMLELYEGVESFWPGGYYLSIGVLNHTLTFDLIKPAPPDKKRETA